MAKRKNDNAKQASSPFNTGGGGFPVEDRVAAWMLAHMLAGAIPPGVDVTQGWHIAVVRWQVPVAQWLFDDLLIELVSPVGFEMCLGISVKSGSYFEELLPPAEVIENGWRQILGVGVKPLRNGVDRFAVAVPPLQSGYTKQWLELWEWASVQDDATLEKNVATANVGNDEKRAIISALGCPAKLADGRSVDLLRTGRFLRHFRIIEQDLRNPTESQRLSDAIALCQGAVGGSVQQANALWDDLVKISTKMRPNAGRIDLPKLLAGLRGRHRLVAHPDYAPDLRRLDIETQRRLARVPDAIGTVRLARAPALAAIQDELRKNRFVVLVAEPGDGKTVMAKRLADKLVGEGKRVLWLEPDQINDPAGVGASIKLDFPLAKVVETVPDSEAYLFVDRNERLNEVGRANLRELLRSVDATSVWRTLAVCVTSEWQRLRAGLVSPQFSPDVFRPVVLPEFTQGEVKEALGRHANLQVVVNDPRLRRLLQRPRVLDLIASNSVTQEHIGSWVAESDIISWFFGSVIDQQAGDGRRPAALRLAASLADNFFDSIPEDELDPGETAAVASLANDRVLRREDGHIGFDHDLLADWCRRQYLVARSRDIAPVIQTTERRHNPVWHRALRLFGLRLLEEQKNTADFIALLRALEPDGERTDLGDELLASPIQAADPAPILDQLWPYFFENNSPNDLLPRLLERAHSTMSVPHPQYGRIPATRNWPNLVRWLHRRQAQLPAEAIRWAATISDTWLRGSETSWPARREAAEMAVAIATDLRSRREDFGIGEETETAIYLALFAASTVLPDVVVDLLRHFAELCPEATAADETPGPDCYPDAVAPDPRRPVSPYAPLRRVASAFEEICQTWLGLDPLIKVRPAAASDIILATLLPHQDNNPYFSYGSDRLDYSAANEAAWSPALWWRGPFARMLWNNERIGIDLILNLVNHVTDVWRYDHERSDYVDDNEHPAFIEIEVDGIWRQWNGGGTNSANVFEWHTLGHRCPSSVQCALMALEHYLYAAEKEQRLVDHAVQQIMRGSTSAAFMGVLASVANHRPALVDGPLKPLLTSADGVWIDEIRRQKRDDRSCAGIGLSLRSIEIQKQIRDWYLMPHRDKGLLGHLVIATQRPDDHGMLARVRQRLEQRIASGGAIDPHMPLHLFAAYYDPANWKASPVNGNIHVEFIRPAGIGPTDEEITENAQRQERLFTPADCWQRLEKNNPCSPEDLAKMWSRMEKFAAERAAGDDDRSLADGIAGIAAVLLILHSDWLDADAGRRSRCVEMIDGLRNNPPSPTGFNVANEMYPYGWDRFVADAVVVEWSRTPSDSIARIRVAEQVTSYYHEVLLRSLKRAIERRDSIGPDEIGRLLHLTLRFAGLRSSIVERRIEIKEFETRRNDMIASFVNMTLNPVESAWETIRQEFGGLDPETLEQLMEAVPSPKSTIASGNWPKWQLLLTEALRWVCAEDHGHKLTFKVLNLSAEIAAWTSDDALATQIFNVVLSMSSDRAMDIGSFGNCWTVPGVDDQGSPPKFGQRWNMMISRAFESDSLRDGDRMEATWHDLLGLGGFVQREWRAEHAPFFAAIQGSLRRWVTTLADDRGIGHFSRLLLKPVGVQMLPDAIIWIATNPIARDSATWRHEDERRPVLALLEYMAKSYSAELRNNSSVRVAYLSVLSAIAATGDIAAVDLQTKVGRL